jgi:hypothetical protein
MCEILVRAVDGTCTDPIANPLRGMPVVVKPDGHTWGNAECMPEYVVIKLPGTPVSAVEQYAASWVTVTDNGELKSTITTHGRRRYLVPNVVVNAAERNGGTYTRTVNQLTAALIDRAA